MTTPGDAPPIDPDDAAGREFSRARKGYDPSEVRLHLGKLAAEIQRLRAVEADLRARLAEATSTSGQDVSLDPATLSRVLGEETVRILDTAREAGEEIRTKAEENAGRVVRDAHDRANRLTRDAAELREAAAREADELAASALADADALRTAAAEEAEATLTSAREEAASMREEAALILDEKTTEAQLEATRIRAEAEEIRTEAEAEARTRLEAADAEAAEIRDQATVDAEAEIEAAREAGREMIREAKEARERMIRDLAERRQASRQQLEAMRAGRERLIEAFATAREAIDDVTDGLVESLPAAREAADAAARTVHDDLDQATRELDLLISRGATIDELIEGDDEAAAEADALAAAETAAASDGVVTDAADDVDAVVEDDSPDDAPGDTAATLAEVTDIGTAPSSESAEPGEGDGTLAPVLVLGSTDDGESAADEAPVVVDLADDDSDDDDDLDDDLDEDEDDADDEDDLDEDEDEDDGDDLDDDEDDDEDDEELTAEAPQPGRLRLVASNEGGPSPVGIEALVDDEAADAAAAVTVAVAAEPPAARSAEVEQLFARLRADRGADDDDDLDLDDDDLDDDLDDDEDGVVATTEAVVIDLSVIDVVEADDVEVAADAEESAAAAHQAMLDQRDALIGELSQGLTRRIRRVVTDQENEVLDLVRRNRRLKGADDLIPGRDEQLDAFRTATHRDLRQIVAAGAEFANGGALDEAVIDATLDDLLASLGEWGVDPLRQRLSRVVEETDDTTPDRTELIDRLRAAYREWRNDRIGELAGDVATLAFSRGVMAGTGPDERLCWLVDHGGLPCPDGEDNQLAGPVPVGEQFPTGDLCPPAHPGCRCLLVPATR